MALHLNVGNDGRILIPKEIRQKLGINKNNSVIANIDENGLYITTVQNSLSKARALVNQFCGSDESITDLLISERRAEASREEIKFNQIQKKYE
jgi:AbrB family looped-hinge helix DNA binding protein